MTTLQRETPSYSSISNLVYFYIATTLTKSSEVETINDLNARAFKGTGFGNSVNATAEKFDYQIPNLKLGNLDSLMFISE